MDDCGDENTMSTQTSSIAARALVPTSFLGVHCALSLGCLCETQTVDMGNVDHRDENTTDMVV